ncbi:hypothetical protein F5Y03DRAFT_212675 [Xylaria venustula]|nr:hypothetical protein F5Y03DRAFT_212675 [Xylaria venustula]
MAENNAESIAKDPVANADDKARDTTDSLPPITKEATATAAATLAPSVPDQSTAADAPAASSSDVTTKPEVPALAVDAQKDSINESSKSDAEASHQEKPSDSAPAPVSQPATTETVASEVGSGAPAGPEGMAEPPKPVSLEEVRDEELPDAKPSDLQQPADGASKETDASSTVKNGDAAAGDKRKPDDVKDSDKTESDSAENGDAEPPEKKPKTNGTNTNGAGRKPGRPRKDKTAAVPVGRTARKTRSQGAAE